MLLLLLSGHRRDTPGRSGSERRRRFSGGTGAADGFRLLLLLVVGRCWLDLSGYFDARGVVFHYDFYFVVVDFPFALDSVGKLFFLFYFLVRFIVEFFLLLSLVGAAAFPLVTVDHDHATLFNFLVLVALAGCWHLRR